MAVGSGGVHGTAGGAPCRPRADHTKALDALQRALPTKPRNVDLTNEMTRETDQDPPSPSGACRYRPLTDSAPRPRAARDAAERARRAGRVSRKVTLGPAGFEQRHRSHRPTVEGPITWLPGVSRRVSFRGAAKNNVGLRHRTTRLNSPRPGAVASPSEDRTGS